MKEIAIYDNKHSISTELEVDIKDVESYFRNYQINKFYPIRDLKPSELALVKKYEDTKYLSEYEIKSLCQDFKIDLNDYMKDRWLLPKEMLKLTNFEYNIIMKHAKYIIEPFLNYGNYRAPRLKILSKEEMATLLSNIATGLTLIPGEQLTTRMTMEAMDRLLKLYDELPAPDTSSSTAAVKSLSADELVLLIDKMKEDVK